MSSYTLFISSYPVISQNEMWHVDSLLGNDGEIRNYTTTVTKQWLRKKACFLSKNCISTEERYFLRGPYRDVISGASQSSRELLLREAGSWGRG
jgi:hypothetical protein